MLVYLIRGICCLCVCVVLIACSARLSPVAPTRVVERPEPPVATATFVPSPIPSPVISPQETRVWQRRWLSSDPCGPPCWDGFIPQTTPYTDVHDRLARQSIVTDIEEYVDPDFVVTIWSVGEAAVSVKADSRESPIKNIQLSFPEPLRFGEIQASFGNPSHVVAMHHMEVGEYPLDFALYDHSYVLMLIYHSRGFRLTYSDAEQPELNAVLPLDSVVFFDSATPLADVDPMYIADAPIIEWQDGQTFAWYCNQSKGYTNPCE